MFFSCLLTMTTAPDPEFHVPGHVSRHCFHMSPADDQHVELEMDYVMAKFIDGVPRELTAFVC